jgi:hypothetical protein
VPAVRQDKTIINTINTLGNGSLIPEKTVGDKADPDWM